jgi:hypothetical protein
MNGGSWKATELDEPAAADDDGCGSYRSSWSS